MQLKPAAPLLYGWMFEDINVGVLMELEPGLTSFQHSGDGGLYGELICNRAFQGQSIPQGQYTTI